MEAMAVVTRVFEFDAAHRVMNERVKCYNLHGHRFRLEVSFGISPKFYDLGYPIDFKELKRVFGAYIDEFLDHACIVNPKDREVIDLCTRNKWKLWVMGHGADVDRNPSAENLAEEIFTVFRELAQLSPEEFDVRSVKLYETPNCWVQVSETQNYLDVGVKNALFIWRDKKGTFEYDSRRCQ